MANEHTRHLSGLAERSNPGAVGTAFGGTDGMDNLGLP